ncbi:endosome-associated-trafficking regulator 1-like isoform X3 [Vanacampus margaritifer]
MSTRGKTLIITEDESEECNPFSFREFLRSKNHDRNLDEDGAAWEVCARAREEDDASAACWQRLRSDADSSAFPSTFDDGDPDVTLPIASRGRSLQELREENATLRRSMRELRRTSQANERRAEALQEELERRRRQEREEAQDLDNMVHSVERNLHHMTKRALSAESGVARMKAELQQLQEELECRRSENLKLKSDQRDVVTAMKHSANMASDYLDKTATHAHSSVRRLLEGAETLRLVSQLLRSIHKMAEVTSDA